MLYRFAVGCYEPSNKNFKIHVTTQFLSPQITYTVNLVFKRKNSNEQYIGLSYKLEGEEDKSYLFVSDKREDGWLTVELYQFTSQQKAVDLEIMFYTQWCSNILVESIEFRPLEKVEHEVLTNDEVDMQPIPDTETYWEQKLPIDYEEIIKLSKDGVQWKTKKELYHILSEGFLINSGEEWFSLAKDGKRCLMLPAKAVLKENEWYWDSNPETRFGQVAYCISKTFGIFCKFSSKMLSPETPYAAFLVYELPENYHAINPPLQVVDKNSDSEAYNIFLRTPKTPVIRENLNIERTYNPSIRPVIKGLPKQRRDGWMEVHLYEFQMHSNIKTIDMHLQFSSYDMSLEDITVQGLEFRPI
ncbi:putative F-box protein PP2-B12 isoform X2 [Bidens hawaiensis]|uniref:putative F-box protein PP2-B12 isoform X2 n=1 Tax=Bidens hawaiensis TaxID=980011 RepID=UPI004049E11B